MLDSTLSREEYLDMFREDVKHLITYVPYLENKRGSDVSRDYRDGDKMKNTISFPVYDPTLLSFVNDCSMTMFMETNYPYFYTRNFVKDSDDEKRMIEKADIMHMDILRCILSKYIFGGLTKAYLWKEGVDNGVFVAVLKKAREIIEFWDRKDMGQ